MTAPYTHRGWRIDYDSKPIPIRACDWEATHPDYDGEGDDRHFTGPTRSDVCAQVDDWIADNCEACDGEGNVWNNADPTSGQRFDCTECSEPALAAVLS